MSETTQRQLTELVWTHLGEQRLSPEDLERARSFFLNARTRKPLLAQVENLEHRRLVEGLVATIAHLQSGYRPVDSIRVTSYHKRAIVEGIDMVARNEPLSMPEYFQLLPLEEFETA